MEEKITISISEYKKLKGEIERLRKNNEVCIEVIEYISKGSVQAINDWGKEL